MHIFYREDRRYGFESGYGPNIGSSSWGQSEQQMSNQGNQGFGGSGSGR